MFDTLLGLLADRWLDILLALLGSGAAGAWLLRRMPGFRLKKGLELLGPGVERVDKRLRSSRASYRRKQQFYAGGALQWDVISARADVERDLYRELLPWLRNQSNHFRLLCLVGPSGAGKSTLARRLAANLSKEHGELVLWIKRPDDLQVWDGLPEFTRHIKRHVYLLADDLFRNEQTARVLKDLDSNLTVTLVATSRHKEYYRGRLPFQEVRKEPLPPPSADEKRRLSKKLPDGLETVPNEHQLSQARTFQALMFLLTRGQDHAEAICEDVESLRTDDEIGYRGYMYVCFCHQYGYSIPRTILTSIDKKFHRLDRRPRVKDLIVPDERLPSNVMAGHTLVARIAYDAGCFKPPESMLAEIVCGASAADDSEAREFTATFIRRLARVEPNLLGRAHEPLSKQVRQFASNASTTAELGLWRDCLKILRLDAQLSECEDRILDSEPSSSRGWIVWLDAVTRDRSISLERAVHKAREWLSDNPEDRLVRHRLLLLLRDTRDPEECRSFFEQTLEWLERHPENQGVRTRFLQFLEDVREKLSSSDRQRALNATLQSLRAYPDNRSVRVKMLDSCDQLGLRPGDQIIRRLWEETRHWLQHNEEDSYVRTQFLEFAGKYGPLTSTYRDTRQWLASHPDASNVRTKFLDFVDHYGTANQLAETFDTTLEWIQQNPENDATLRTKFLDFAEAHASPHQFCATVDAILPWLCHNADDVNVRSKLLLALRSAGTREQQVELTRQTLMWIQQDLERPGIEHVYIALSKLFQEQELQENEGSLEEIEAASLGWLEHALQYDEPTPVGPNKNSRHLAIAIGNWFRSHEQFATARRIYDQVLADRREQANDDVALRALYHRGLLGLLEEQPEEAERDFVRLLTANPDHIAARIKLAWALQRKATVLASPDQRQQAFESAGVHLKRALGSTERKKEETAHIHARFGDLFLAQGRPKEAVAAFATANKNQKHPRNYEGMAKAFELLGNTEKADLMKRHVNLIDHWSGCKSTIGVLEDLACLRLRNVVASLEAQFPFEQHRLLFRIDRARAGDERDGWYARQIHDAVQEARDGRVDFGGYQAWLQVAVIRSEASERLVISFHGRVGEARQRRLGIVALLLDDVPTIEQRLISSTTVDVLTDRSVEVLSTAFQEWLDGMESCALELLHVWLAPAGGSRSNPL